MNHNTVVDFEKEFFVIVFLLMMLRLRIFNDELLQWVRWIQHRRKIRHLPVLAVDFDPMSSQQGPQSTVDPLRRRVWPIGTKDWQVEVDSEQLPAAAKLRPKDSSSSTMRNDQIYSSGNCNSCKDGMVKDWGKEPKDETRRFLHHQWQSRSTRDYCNRERQPDRPVWRQFHSDGPTRIDDELTTGETAVRFGGRSEERLSR